MADSATFRVRSLLCRDETGGSWREEFGNDEIKCAVFSADLRGSPRSSGMLDIYSEFDDDDVMRFDPPKEMLTIDLAGKTGDLDLAFSVMLIEKQARRGEALEKAWEAFSKEYTASLTAELSRLQLSIDDAYAIAQPGYLAPQRIGVVDTERTPVIGSPLGDGGLIGVAGSSAGTSARTPENTNVVSADAGADDDEDDDEEEKKGLAVRTGDAIILAVITAIAAFVVKFGPWVVNALIGWQEDKLFAPVKVQTKVDATNPDSNSAATGKVEFRGHDGIYELEWDVLVT